MVNKHTFKPAADETTLRRLYEADGKSQVEVAKSLGVSQKIVFGLMRRYGIPARPAVKRNQFGAFNSSWRGGNAKYAALHLRVGTLRGKPKKCEVCGTDDKSKRYEWASLSYRYDDPSDYKRMCCSCHKRHDKIINNILQAKARREVS